MRIRQRWIRQGFTEDRWQKFFDQFKALGNLKQYKEVEGTVTSGYFNGVKSITATYYANESFDSGDAQIKIVLSKDTGQWRIVGLWVNKPL
jgi:hypothetical protein